MLMLQRCHTVKRLTGIKSKVVECRSDEPLLIEVPHLVLCWVGMLAVDDDVCTRVFVAASHVQHFAMHLAHQKKITSAPQNGHNHSSRARGGKGGGAGVPQDKKYETNFAQRYGRDVACVVRQSLSGQASLLSRWLLPSDVAWFNSPRGTFISVITSHLSQLSLAIPSWIGAMSIGLPTKCR